MVPNNGRPMMTVVRDTVGAHDTSAGACACEANTVRFGHEVQQLRAEMDVICLISNCPQINNPCNGFNPTPVDVLIWPPKED